MEKSPPPTGVRGIAYHFPECKASWAAAADPPPVRSPFPSRKEAAPHSGIVVWWCPKWSRHPRHRVATAVVPACRVSPYRWTMSSRWTFEDPVFSRVCPRRDKYFIEFGAINLSGYRASGFTFFVDGKLTDGRCQKANNVEARCDRDEPFFCNMNFFQIVSYE